MASASMKMELKLCRSAPINAAEVGIMGWVQTNHGRSGHNGFGSKLIGADLAMAPAALVPTSLQHRPTSALGQNSKYFARRLDLAKEKPIGTNYWWLNSPNHQS
jgi:hypothetical protein